MKKFFKSTIVRIILVFLIVIVIGFVWLFSKMPKMGPNRIQLTENSVGVVSGNSYVWIIRTPHGAILVDTGMDPQAATVIAELKAQALDPEDVHTILLTHGHLDHWIGTAAFPETRVMVGPGDAALVRRERMPKGTLTRLMGGFYSGIGPPLNLQELKGNETLDIDGESFQVISLPGHTPGSVAYLWHDILFSGDSLMGRGDGVFISPSFFSDDTDLNRESIKKLLPLSFSRAADGHTGVVEDAHRKLETYLAR